MQRDTMQRDAAATSTEILVRAPWNRAAWWLAGVLAGLSMLLGIYLLLRTPVRAPYRVTQVTYSGHVLTNDLDVENFSSSASDGTRIYFSHMDNGTPELAVALIANGEISHIRLPSDIGAPLIGSLAPDGAKLVVRGHLQTEPEQPLWIVPTLGGDARRVPNVLAHDATWMPDGRRLLVASGNELFVVGADGGDARKFLTAPGLAFWLRWSPDSRRLRFTLLDPKRQTSELWEVSSDGSNLHPLLPGWNQPASESCGSWTADGKDFVFQSWHNGHSDVWALAERPWFLGHGQPRRITNGPLDYAAPTTAPAGRRVFFIGNTAQFELLRAIPGTSAFTALDQNLSAAALAQFSSDGKWVAWLNAADLSLWRSRVDGSERIELTNPPLRIFTMKWSPDNRRLAVMAEEPGKPWKIYLIDADGGKLTPALDEERNEADPNWTPDGESIVFGRPPDRMDNGQPKAIYILNLTTKKMTEIPGSAGLFSPRLSPNGRYLVAMPLDQHALLLFDRETNRWITLTTHGAGDPTWSHDSRFVYFQDFLEDGKPIYRIAVPSSKIEAMATIDNLQPISATDYRLIGLAPGDLPVVTARTPAVNLYQVDLEER
jgi:Tol biopolymer transport system component